MSFCSSSLFSLENPAHNSQLLQNHNMTAMCLREAGYELCLDQSHPLLTVLAIHTPVGVFMSACTVCV